MITVKLTGGLGNQMFQYAFGRSLALWKNTSLQLDTTSLEKGEGTTPRTYALDAFQIDAPRVAYLSPLRPTITDKIANRWEKQFVPYYRRRTIVEKSSRYDARLRSCRDDAILEGYWQSEKYFEDHTNQIWQDLTFKNAPAGKNKTYIALMQSIPSVSIHVRRGDYVNHPLASAVYIALDANYYNRAIAQLATLSDEAFTYFVFSDDPAWVEQNLSLPTPYHLVDHNGPDQAAEDLRLMSLCQHHVIANSSFSWWGAWLNPNPKKIVIAPQRWFKTEQKNSEDIVPKSWIFV